MKSWNAAALGLFVGVAVMWFGGERAKAFFHRDSCGCPTPHGATASMPGEGAPTARASCPAHLDGDQIVVDDKQALLRVRLALRDGIYAPWTELGRAPTKDEVGARLKLDRQQTSALFETLESCGESMGGGILLVPQSDVIAVAWPFANVPTGVEITVDGGKSVHARCAVDALGVSAMLGKRATIDAETTDDHAPVHVVVDGTKIVEASPASLVVMKGPSCDEMLFFSSAAGIDAWKKAHENVGGGEAMTLADATLHGAELFARITQGLPRAGTEGVADSASAQGESTSAVAPWEPIDESFRGCEQSCGSRSTGAQDGVIIQAANTQAKIGDKVYCPVSGVVFPVTDKSAHRDVAGKTVYFCCESCAAYFSANQARVLAARALNPA